MEGSQCFLTMKAQKIVSSYPGFSVRNSIFFHVAIAQGINKQVYQKINWSAGEFVWSVDSFTIDCWGDAAPSGSQQLTGAYRTLPCHSQRFSGKASKTGEEIACMSCYRGCPIGCTLQHQNLLQITTSNSSLQHSFLHSTGKNYICSFNHLHSYWDS